MGFDSQKGDIPLLNSLWKLMNSCYNRDYFVFIQELLPFVIDHYSVQYYPRDYLQKREVCITLSDIIQFLKHSKSDVLQKEVVTIMRIVIDSVRDLTEYLEDSENLFLF